MSDKLGRLPTVDEFLAAYAAFPDVLPLAGEWSVQLDDGRLCLCPLSMFVSQLAGYRDARVNLKVAARALGVSDYSVDSFLLGYETGETESPYIELGLVDDHHLGNAVRRELERGRGLRVFRDWGEDDDDS